MVVVVWDEHPLAIHFGLRSTYCEGRDEAG